MPPAGRAGGNPGQLAELRILRDGVEYTPTELQASIVCPTKFSGLVLKAGDRLSIYAPGGGGYGDPKERDRAAVRRDLRAGYISTQAAVETYGLSAQDAQEASTLTPVGA